MKMKRHTGILRKMWIFFKKGKAEIWFLISLYNTIQLWALGGVNITYGIMALIGLAIGAFFIGIVLTKKVETTNPYVNPYTQDNIKASILFYEAFKLYLEDCERIVQEKEKLKESINKVDEALQIRYNWLDRSLLR